MEGLDVKARKWYHIRGCSAKEKERSQRVATERGPAAGGLSARDHCDQPMHIVLPVAMDELVRGVQKGGV